MPKEQSRSRALEGLLGRCHGTSHYCLPNTPGRIKTDRHTLEEVFCKVFYFLGPAGHIDGHTATDTSPAAD